MKGDDFWACYANRKSDIIRRRQQIHNPTIFYMSSDDEDESPEHETSSSTSSPTRYELCDFLTSLVDLMNEKFTRMEKNVISSIFYRIKNKDEMGNTHEITLCYGQFQYRFVPAKSFIASRSVVRDYFHQSPMAYGSYQDQW